MPYRIVLTQLLFYPFGRNGTQWAQIEKKIWQKFVKLIDHNNAFSIWINLEYEVKNGMTEMEIMWIYRNVFEEFREITFRWTYFWRVLVIWNYCAAAAVLRLRAQGITMPESPKQWWYLLLLLRSGSGNKQSFMTISRKWGIEAFYFIDF